MALPNFPVGAEQRKARLMTKASPQARAWILQEAGRVAVQSGITEQAVIANVRARLSSSAGVPDADIMAIAFVVLMEATNLANRDLESIMAGVKAINDAKERARHAKLAMQKNTASLHGGNPSAFSSAIAPKPKSTPTPTPTPTPMHGRMLTSAAPIAKARLDNQINMARDDADKLDEMGETASLRLQMAMDHSAKMMSTLSNVLKKMSSTDSSIVANLK